MNSVAVDHLELAKAAGFTTAAQVAGEQVELGTKVKRAYDAYQHITKDQLDKFNADLRKKTEKTDAKTRETTWKELVFTPIGQYKTLPPADVLQQVKAARELEIFDEFKVAYIADQKKRRDPDPIVFGYVKNCNDHFYVAQWGDDVKIADLLRA